MKIAILTSEYITENNWHGGLANYLSKITVGLKNRGHEVHVMVYSDRDEVENKDGIIIHRIAFDEKILFILNKLTFRLSPSFLQMMRIAIKFKKYFLSVHEKEKFEIIHSSSCQVPALLINPKKIGIPMVTRMSSVAKQCQIAYNRKNFFDMYLVNKLEELLLKKSTRSFAPSRLVKKIIKKEFDIEIDTLESPEMIENGGELDFLVYDSYLKNKKYLLFYGTLGRLKGSEFLADNIYHLLNKYKDVYFVIVGKMEILRKRVLPIEPILKNSKEHKKRIIYINSLSHKFLIPILKKASAVILPSMIDNLPNTCIESMGQGKIVIGTFDGGFDQLIIDGKNGYVLNYGDDKRLEEVFEFIFKGDGRIRQNIENEARLTISKRLSFNVKITELEKYYEKAIRDFKK